MKFIDPFPTTCEFCDEKGLYPLKELLVYEAHCKICGKKLIEGPLGMHKGRRSVAIELWPINLIWEACEEFDLDLDCISDEEFDSMCLLKDFIVSIEKMGFIGELEMILQLPAMQKLNGYIIPSRLGEYTLEELALLANPEVKPG